MFRLTVKEWKEISSSQIVMSSTTVSGLTSQNVISSWGGRKKLPFAFTEHSVAMLASVLKSSKASTMNVAIKSFYRIEKISFAE